MWSSPSFSKGLLTGLWQVLEKRSVEFSTVPLSRTVFSFQFPVEIRQCKFVKGKKEDRRWYKSPASLPHTYLGTDRCATRRFMLSVIHTDWHQKE